MHVQLTLELFAVCTCSSTASRNHQRLSQAPKPARKPGDQLFHLSDLTLSATHLSLLSLNISRHSSPLYLLFTSVW